jgi:hypothetical protein
MEPMTSNASLPPPTPVHHESDDAHHRNDDNLQGWTRESLPVRGDAARRFHDMMDRESLASSRDSTEGDFDEEKGRAPRIADKVARRLRRAERREQRAEQLIENFAADVEELTLRVEREQLVNEQLRATQGSIDEAREKMRLMQRERVKMEQELNECRQQVKVVERQLHKESVEHQAIVDKYKNDLELVKTEREVSCGVVWCVLGSSGYACRALRVGCFLEVIYIHT